MKKYFFFDIDGTILSHIDHHRIMPSTLATIKELQDRGHFVSLATGRPQFSVVELAKEIGIKHYVCEGGRGLVVDGEFVSYQEPDQAQMRTLVDYFQENHIPYFLNLKNNADLYSFDDTQEESIRRFHRDIHSLEGIDLEKEIIRRIIVETGDRKLVEGAPKVDDVGYIYMQNQCFTVFEPDVKHKGIEIMVNHVKGNMDDVIAFGDGLNDIKMFEHVPLKIAMGNAVDELKEIASYITDTSHDDGIYKACLAHGWIEA